MERMPAIMFACLWLLFIIAVAVRYCFVRSLKVRHFGIWEALGRPGPLPVSGVGTAFSTLQFLTTGADRSLEDRSLSHLATLYRATLIVYFLNFIVLMITSILFLAK
jgi:hypothetical protein